MKRSEVLRERNDFFKVAMKRAIKALRKASLAGGEKLELEGLYKGACQAIDKAQRRNIVHKNNAARKKSRLSVLVNK